MSRVKKRPSMINNCKTFMKLKKKNLNQQAKKPLKKSQPLRSQPLRTQLLRNQLLMELQLLKPLKKVLKSHKKIQSQRMLPLMLLIRLTN